MSDNSSIIVTDSTGRRLALRRLKALDKFRLFKALGADHASNGPALGMGMLAASVVAIDDVPVPMPETGKQIEALIGRLGDEGLEAVASQAEVLMPQQTTEELVAAAKN